MTAAENLLVTAMEECGELAQAISKALRFGMWNYYPDKPSETNARNILVEYEQLKSVMDLLVEQNIVPEITQDEKIAEYRRKRVKVRNFQAVSRQIGTISDCQMGGTNGA